MQVVINDGLNDMLVCLEVDDGYNPDVMDDLTSRAIDLYMKALIRRQVVEDERLERELGVDDGGE